MHKILTHFIAGYPSQEESKQIGKALIEGGACALEMQIPYSDPSADGPVIEAACREALEKGIKVDDCFSLITEIKRDSDVPFYLMSYGGPVYARGIERFIDDAKAAGVDGLIIPDLTPGDDEKLYQIGKKKGMPIIPVVVPSIQDDRLEEILSQTADWVYVALRSGITGTLTDIGESNLTILDKIRSRNHSMMAGFGIQKREQVETLMPHADAVIVGTIVVKTITEAVKSGNDPGEAVKGLLKELI